MAEFYYLNPHVPITIDFQDIKFRYISLALSHSNLGKEVDIRRL